MKDNKIENIDDLGKQHGCELSMMLAGSKKLSVFSYYKDENRDQVLSGQEFDEHVAAGSLYFDSFEIETTEGWVVYELFCVVGEEWRFKAYQLLIEMLYTRSWSIEADWIEARVYGLSPREADLLVRQKLGRRRKQSKNG